MKIYHITQAFICEFINNINKFSLLQNKDLSVLQAKLAARRYDIRKAEELGAIDYIDNVGLNNPPTYVKNDCILKAAWERGYLNEKVQWERDLPESLKEQA